MCNFLLQSLKALHRIALTIWVLVSVLAVIFTLFYFTFLVGIKFGGVCGFFAAMVSMSLVGPLLHVVMYLANDVVIKD